MGVARKVLIICSTDIVKKEGAAYARYRLYGKAIVSCGQKATIVSTLNPLDQASMVIEDGVVFWGRRAKRINGYLLRNLRNKLTFWPYAIYLIKLFILKGLKVNAVIWTPKGFFIDLFAILLIRYLCHIRLVVEINELQSGIVGNTTDSNGTALHYLIRGLSYVMSGIEDRLYVFYNGAIAISTNLYNMMIIRQPQTILIPILVDDVEPKNVLHNNVNEAIFRIGFFGTISSQKEGLDLFLKALHKLKREGYMFRFDMYGFTSHKTQEGLQFLITKMGLREEVSILDAVPHKEIMNYLVNYHLLVLPRKVNKQTKYGFSTKLGEYLISGVPVLITDVSDNGLYIKNRENGLIVRPDSVDDLLNALLYAVKHRSEIELMGKKGRNTAINKLGYQAHAKKLVSFILEDMQ